MNLSLVSNPRFTCRMVRLAGSVAAGAAERHTRHCAGCQAFFHAADTLDHELRREAIARRRAAPEPSPELPRRIMRAVRESTDTPPATFRIPGWAMGAGIVSAVAALLVWQKPAAPAGPGIAATSADAVVIVDAVESFSLKFTRTLIPATGEMLAQNALQQELGSVFSDAQSALDFLALNFLPSTAPPVPSGAEPNSSI